MARGAVLWPTISRVASILGLISSVASLNETETTMSSESAGAPSVPVGRIGEARRLGACVVASGGIGAGNIAQMAEAGADAVGVVSAVFDTEDPERATAALAARFALGAGQR